MFLNRLNGEPIGVSVLGIFVIDKNTILAVRLLVLRDVDIVDYRVDILDYTVIFITRYKVVVYL